MGIFSKFLLSIVKGIVEKFVAKAKETPEEWDDVLWETVLFIIIQAAAQGDRKLGKSDIVAILDGAKTRLAA